MLELMIDKDEYKQIIEQNAKYKKTLGYLKETLSYIQTLNTCSCLKCDKVEEINNYLFSVGEK